MASRSAASRCGAFGWPSDAPRRARAGPRGIAYIGAHSPQAKGRIERLWATLQDRLASELRLRGVATCEAAARFLPEFIADYNKRFARPAADPGAVWRRPPRDLDRILSCRY